VARWIRLIPGIRPVHLAVGEVKCRWRGSA
jgi:hypothetical protein